MFTVGAAMLGCYLLKGTDIQAILFEGLGLCCCLNSIAAGSCSQHIEIDLDRNDNHVLYRVTPIFEGNNLVAK